MAIDSLFKADQLFELIQRIAADQGSNKKADRQQYLDTLYELLLAAVIDTNTWDMANVAIISITSGNDGTAAIGNGNLPFKTVAAATTAGAQYILMTPGNYIETINIADQVHYHCMPGVNFTSGGWRDLTSTGKRAWITGHSTYQINVECLLAYSDLQLDFEFDWMDCKRVASVFGTAIVRIKGNWIRCSSFNSSAHALSVRDSAQCYCVIKYYFHAQHWNINTLYSLEPRFVGTVHVECPDIRTIPNYTSNYGNLGKSCLRANGNTAGTVTIIGDMTNTHNVATSEGVIDLSDQQTPGTVFNIKGSISGGLNRGVKKHFIASEGKMTIEGDIISDINPIDTSLSGVATGDFKLKIKNSRIAGNQHSIIGRGISIYILNSIIENSLAGIGAPIFRSALAGASPSELYSYNSYLQSGGAGTGETFNLFPVDFTVGCANTESTEPIGAGVVDVFGGFSQNSALTIPKF